MIKFNTPNKNNSCGGAYLDWLEINLLKECNACCKWCIELKGYHPKQVVSYAKIAEAALKTEAKNIILLGGEPTLYKDLNKLIECAYICNDSEHRKAYSGDPTEIALLVASEKYMKQFDKIKELK